jgi:nucleotide-binding universal stress UspA family protein
MLTRLLTPLDGSPLAETALPAALTIATPSLETELLLLRVSFAEVISLSPVTAVPVMQLTSQSVRAAETAQEAALYLNRLVSAHGVPGRVVWPSVIRTEVASPDVAGLIIDAAWRHHTELIVMASHGYTGASRWVLGSVAERVISSAPCPTLVVRDHAHLRHMLITLDGSPLAEQVLAPALTVAARLGATVTVLRVVGEGLSAATRPHLHLPQGGPRGALSSEHVPEDMRERVVEHLRQEALTYLRAAIHPYRSLWPVSDLAVRVGPTAETILRYATDHNIDLIAMATHGRSGVRRWIYGSVTDKVLRGARRSMLIVRPD